MEGIVLGIFGLYLSVLVQGPAALLDNPTLEALQMWLVSQKELCGRFGGGFGWYGLGRILAGNFVHTLRRNVLATQSALQVRFKIRPRICVRCECMATRANMADKLKVCSVLDNSGLSPSPALAAMWQEIQKSPSHHNWKSALEPAFIAFDLLYLTMASPLRYS